MKTYRYYDDAWKKDVQVCTHCGWQGIFKAGEVDYRPDYMICQCPGCDNSPVIACVMYPTVEECEANWDKLPDTEKEKVRFIRRREATLLKSEDQLPEIQGESFELTWDILQDGESDKIQVILLGEREIWREIACYESFDRFEELVAILKRKYGKRLRDLAPTDRSELYLYGDDLSASNRVSKARLSLKRG